MCVCVSSVGLFRHSSYVRFDILQRILSRLFGITVIHAMVITDIDDKIIRRSWEVRPSCTCWLLLCSHLLTSCFMWSNRKTFPQPPSAQCTRTSSRGTCCRLRCELRPAADQPALQHAQDKRIDLFHEALHNFTSTLSFSVCKTILFMYKHVFMLLC